MNRSNYDNNDDYRTRERNSRDFGHSSRRRRSRSRSRSRDNYRESKEDVWPSSSRYEFYPMSVHVEDNNLYSSDRYRNRDKYRDREYERRDKHFNRSSNRYYESDDNGSDGGSAEPNNKVIVRGLAQHITEADIQCDLIQCGLKPSSIRLIRKKSTGASRGFAFVTFTSIDEAKSWIEKKQGVLILQDQYRGILQYSFTKDNDGQWDKVQADWYCGKCGVFNFKRRDNCFKCAASREESGSEGFDEISSILTKKIMLRNLDALTTEEKVLTVLQEKIPETVSKITKIQICRDVHTKISRGICYVLFDNLVDSMNTFQALEKLQYLEIDNRQVSFSYCVDSENQSVARSHLNNNGSKRDKVSTVTAVVKTGVSTQSNYQYCLADVQKLAEQASTMYAQNSIEKESYLKYYTDFYTNQIIASQSQSSEANSGASIAQTAMERKQQKIKTDTVPNGTDGKKYPTPDVNQMQYDESGYFFDRTTNLYFDQSSNYFYNSELGQYLYWDAVNSTYILASVEPSSVAQLTNAKVTVESTPPPPPSSTESKDQKKSKEPQDKVKVAKNIVKDMEKWAKKLNSKKDYTPTIHQQQVPRNDLPSISTNPDLVSDICFSMLDKKDHPPTSVLNSIDNSDSEEDQAAIKSAAAASCFNENDLVDFEKLTCFLCKRAFHSIDILNKHIKQSILHKENLQKYKLQNGILDIESHNDGGNTAALNYRDRAKERRLKYGEADPLPPINKAKERYQREIEKKASLVQTYQSQSLASRPIDENNKGSKLLKAMGWREGSGLGKTGQGRTEIIETEQRISNAGLGSKNASYGAGPGDDYKSYIKKMMKKRYEET